MNKMENLSKLNMPCIKSNIQFTTINTLIIMRSQITKYANDVTKFICIREIKFLMHIDLGYTEKFKMQDVWKKFNFILKDLKKQ